MSSSGGDKITMEQAWNFWMTQYAYRNPALIFQGHLAKLQLAHLMTSRRK